MSEAVSPSTGLAVVHLFCTRGPLTENEEVVAAVKAAESAGVQVVSVAVFGHKAELAFMLLGPELWALRDTQTALTRAGLVVVDSYVSLTELSEYAQGLPDAMKQARLFPQLPPEGKPAWCFYPMSKKREAHANWFTLPFEDRSTLMHEHGASGRKFAGRILQLITGSAGLDDYEWGVTLFGQRPDDLKDVVYTMRFDKASADYAEFGPFYTGLVTTVEDLMARAPDMADVERLRQRLRELDRVIVAFSGGADSALLAWLAHDTLGPERARVVTAISPSLAGFEADDCALLAREWQLNWTTVATDEMANAAYRVNDANRCFHCKDALMDALEPLARADGSTIVLGVNVDDLGDHRPGQTAAAQRGAAFPFVDAGFTKADVRAASEAFGLRTWDKPAAACLASRLPYGSPVSIDVLASVEQAELALRSLGFRALRVRHYRDTARLEVPLDELAHVLEQREAVVAAVKGAGYRYVTLDLEGLRSGNLNDALRVRSS